MNEQPRIPGVRSATLNAHGDIARTDVLQVSVLGSPAYIDREAFSGERVQLRQYRKDGTVLGRFNSRARTFTPAGTIHRDNVA